MTEPKVLPKTCEVVDRPEDIEHLVRRGWFGKAMTAEEREEQRRSFAHANASLNNPKVTRELIDQEAESGSSSCPASTDSKSTRTLPMEQVERDIEVPDPREKDVVFWSCDDGEEQLSCEDPDEAIEEFCDGWLNPTMTPEQVLEVLPEEVTIYGFARMKPFLLENESLDHLLEVLDEEYGDPDGGSTEPTKAMIEAEKKFHDVVISEYESWACKQVCERTVNTKEWILKNRPDWLE